jgi:threonine dehydratase
MPTDPHVRDDLLSPTAVHAAREKLKSWIVQTPIYRWRSLEMANLLGADTKVIIKLELFQNTNTFKPRGALNVMLNATPDKLKNGIVAGTGGNHGIAVAYAAKMLGHQAKIVMPRTASSLRRARIEYYGAEIMLVENLGEALEIAAEIEQKENRLFVHPFEGPYTAQGTAMVADEWKHQATAPLDAVIIPIGGGGLIAGMASYFKQVWPKIKVYGVEPEGVPTIYESLQAGRPVQASRVQTIADSLAVPIARPYSFDLIQKYVDDVILISDDAMRHAMHFMFNEIKLVTEPASAAGLAALMGPLREKLTGQRVGLIACGSNLDIAAFSKEIFRAEID